MKKALEKKVRSPPPLYPTEIEHHKRTDRGPTRLQANRTDGVTRDLPSPKAGETPLDGRGLGPCGEGVPPAAQGTEVAEAKTVLRTGLNTL